MEVYLDGRKIFDRKEEGNIYPVHQNNLKRVREMKAEVQAKLDSIPAHADD